MSWRHAVLAALLALGGGCAIAKADPSSPVQCADKGGQKTRRALAPCRHGAKSWPERHPGVTPPGRGRNRPGPRAHP